MASGRMEFHAESIMQHTNFSFVLPNDVAMEEVFDPKYYDRDPVNLILLHGLTGTDTDWLYGGVAQLMAIQYNVNIFMPTTGNSFYLDKGYQGRNHCGQPPGRRAEGPLPGCTGCRAPADSPFQGRSFPHLCPCHPADDL